jgi:hypothetical protein
MTFRFNPYDALLRPRSDRVKHSAVAGDLSQTVITKTVGRLRMPFSK